MNKSTFSKGKCCFKNIDQLGNYRVCSQSGLFYSSPYSPATKQLAGTPSPASSSPVSF